MALRSSQESNKTPSSGHPLSTSSPPSNSSQNSSMNPITDASNMKEMSDRLLETFLSNCR